MNPIISIIIPTLNEEKAIERTVGQFSVLHVPHEVIVSDTGSKDQTVAIAKRVADRVVIPLPKEKEGVSRGRNDGAAVASGTFLVFIDSDTFIPDLDAFFKKALARFEKTPGLVGISCRINVEKEIRTRSDHAVSFLMNFWFFLLNKFGNVGIASGKFQMVKADVFRKTGGFDENLTTAEDVDFFARLRTFGITRIAWDLEALHGGRRFHKIGAWRTLYLWIHNGVSFWLFKTPSKTWEAIR